MGKIKNIIFDQKNSIKQIFFKYTVTITSVSLISIIYILLNTTNYRYDSDDMIQKILTFFVILAVGSFFVESVLKSDGINTILFWAGHALNFVIAVILDIISFTIDNFAGDKGRVLFYKIIILYVILALGLSMYKIIRNSGLGFHKYAVSLISGLFKVTGVFLALDFGLMLLISIFNTLITNIDTWDTIYNFQIFLLGFVYFPYALICITDNKDNQSKFLKNFLMYALMPMVIAALAMVYIYGFKILITWSIPSNQVFNICLWIFIIGAVIWTMANSFIMQENEGKISKYKYVIKYMKYIYAPVILLEVLSIGLRINQYGVTNDRYYGVIAIIFQIIYVFWEPIINLISKVGKKAKISYGEYYEGLIFVVIVLYFICFLTPIINCDYMSFRSQKNRFEKNIHMGDDYIYEAAGAYRFLKYNEYGSEYLNSTYSAEELSAIDAIADNIGYNNIIYDNSWDYVRFKCIETPCIDISGYSYLYSLGNQNREINNENEIEYYSETILVYGTENQEFKVDLTGFIRYMNEMDEYLNSSLVEEQEPYEIILDDNSKLLITNCSFDINVDKDSIKGLYIDGYVLKKNK